MLGNVLIVQYARIMELLEKACLYAQKLGGATTVVKSTNLGRSRPQWFEQDIEYEQYYRLVFCRYALKQHRFVLLTTVAGGPEVTVVLSQS